MPRIPRIDVYERTFNGTNDNGMKIRNEMSFHIVVETSGIRAWRESAKSTTRATLHKLTRINGIPGCGKLQREEQRDDYSMSMSKCQPNRQCQ